MLQWLLRLCVCCLALLLAGCSSMQLAYVNAPLLAQYQLDRYFDLNDEQEQVLKAELTQLRAWHQSQVLSVYAKTLRQWSQTLSQPQTFSTDMIQAQQQRVQQAVLLFAQHAAQALSPLLMTLTEHQKRQLLSRFESSNEEYRQDFLDNPQKAARLRRERFTQNYERWLGPLNPAQLALLSGWLEQHPNDTQRWAQERLNRQKALLEIIDQAPQFESRQQAAQALEAYFSRLIDNQTSDLQTHQASRQLALAALTAQMLNLMTPRQRQHVQDELNSYATDFEALAKRATSLR